MGELLREMELLKGLTEKEYNLLADGLVSSTVEAGHILLEGGEAKTDQLWFVLEGQAVATLPDNEHYRDVFEKGDYFGELSLTLRPSLHAVAAIGELQLLQLGRDGLKQMPGASAKKITKTLGASKAAQKRRHELSLRRAATKQLLSLSSLMDNLTLKERDHVADAVERIDLKEGDVMLAGGAEGDEIWFVQDGLVGSTDDSDEWLGPQAVVAEEALLRTIVHPASVTARSETVLCLKLHRRSFETLVGCDCETVLKRDPVAYQRRMLQQSFNHFDVDGSGTIDTDEVRQAMAQQGIEMTQEEVDELFASVDDDGSGEIDFVRH
jgi:CRP-like cAMP-binding protein